jgi:hypothetical protein
MTKQNLLEDKDAYLREDVLVAKKMPQYSCLSKRRSFEASLIKLDCPISQTGVSSFSRKSQNFWTVQQMLPGGP